MMLKGHGYDSAQSDIVIEVHVNEGGPIETVIEGDRGRVKEGEVTVNQGYGAVS